MAFASRALSLGLGGGGKGGSPSVSVFLCVNTNVPTLSSCNVISPLLCSPETFVEPR